MGDSRILLSVLLLAFSLPSLWAPGPAANRKGNQAFRKGQTDRAVGQYERALQALPADKRFTFNKGTAYLGGQKLDDALASLMSAASDPRREVRGPALYNAGNALYAGQKLDQALDAWRQAILTDPGNMEAKYNYELARRRQEEQQKNQKKQDKQDQKNQKNQPQQPQDQQPSDQQKQDQPQPGQPNQPQPQPDQPPNPADQQPGPPQNDERKPVSKLTKEQAERLLDALQANEKQMLKDRLKAHRRKDVEKDW